MYINCVMFCVSYFFWSASVFLNKNIYMVLFRSPRYLLEILLRLLRIADVISFCNFISRTVALNCKISSISIFTLIFAGKSFICNFFLQLFRIFIRAI